jgi:hypothetical protein
MAIFFGPYSLSMAQASIRGACGFVLAGNTPAIQESAFQWIENLSMSELGWMRPLKLTFGLVSGGLWQRLSGCALM